MKNAQIHDGLPDQCVRDALAPLFQKLDLACGYKSVRTLEHEIEKLQGQLSMVKQRDGLLALFKDRGWSDHDVGDDISDYRKDTYFPFLGTDEEFAAFAARLEAENGR